ncbi:hypothetical protein DYH09_01255 [bacterium CPR1]|nr:hypothetical protein [bacterium CPR1]
MLLCLLGLLVGQGWSQSIQLKVKSPASGSTVPKNFTIKGTAPPGSKIVVSGTLTGQGGTSGAGEFQVSLFTGSRPAGTELDLQVFTMSDRGHRSNVVKLKLIVGSERGTPPPSGLPPGF